jgi:steroid delta-isomerase-like uncharacterized protein
MADNTAIVVRFIHECWNLRSKTIFRELLSPDYEHYMPGNGQPTVGPDAYQQMVEGFLKSFPDTSFEIEDAFGEGGKVCVLWTLRATQQGEFAGIDATGKPIVVKGVAVARVVDGWIVRIISMFDNSSFLQQLA